MRASCSLQPNGEWGSGGAVTGRQARWQRQRADCASREGARTVRTSWKVSGALLRSSCRASMPSLALVTAASKAGRQGGQRLRYPVVPRGGRTGPRRHKRPQGPHTAPPRLLLQTWRRPNDQVDARRGGGAPNNRANRAWEGRATQASRPLAQRIPPTPAAQLTSVATLMQQVGHHGACESLIVHEEHVNTGSGRRGCSCGLGNHRAVWPVNCVVHGQGVGHGPTHLGLGYVRCNCEFGSRHSTGTLVCGLSEG